MSEKLFFFLCLGLSVWLFFLYKRTLRFVVVDRPKMQLGYALHATYSLLSCLALLVIIHYGGFDFRLLPGPYSNWLTAGNSVLLAWLVHCLISLKEVYRCEDDQPRGFQ